MLYSMSSRSLPAANRSSKHRRISWRNRSRSLPKAIALQLLSAAYGYRVATQVFNDGDPQISRAVDAMPRAREFAQAASRARARG